MTLVGPVGGASPEEGHSTLSGHSFGQQGLASARGSVKQQAGAGQTQSGQLRALQGQQNSVQDVLLHLLQATHVLPAHRRDLHTVEHTQQTYLSAPDL